MHLTKTKRFIIFLVAEIILFAVFFMMEVFVGPSNFFCKNSATNEIAKSIVFRIRLPRAILAALSGMLLAGSGCIFQGFFRNPLAEPGIMGVTSGATLGAVLALLLPGGTLIFAFMPIFAFFGAILSGILVFAFSRKASVFTNSASIILTGTALGTFFSALTSIVLVSHQNQLQAVYTWLLGSFSGRGWTEVKFIFVPAIICFALFFICSHFLNVIALGETSAQALGLNLKKAQILVLVTGSLCCAASVCAGGTIGFVGLISPHILRKLYGSDNKTLVVLSSIFGGILLLLCDTLARLVILPSELPVGIITSLIGAPCFISILVNSRGGAK